jgi:hypothetical protein
MATFPSESADVIDRDKGLAQRVLIIGIAFIILVIVAVIIIITSSSSSSWQPLQRRQTP